MGSYHRLLGWPLGAPYSPKRLAARMRVLWRNPEWVHLSGNGRWELPVRTAGASLLPLLMDRCDDSRSDPRPKLLTVLVGPTGRRRGVRFLQVAAILV